MKISELPPGLKELAEKRRKEFSPLSGNDHLGNAFGWKETPEGGNFWVCVNRGDFSIYHGCRDTNLKRKDGSTKH